MSRLLFGLALVLVAAASIGYRPPVTYAAVESPNIILGKLYEGSPTLLFTFVFNTEGSVCQFDINDGAAGPIVDGQTFQLDADDTLHLGCPNGTYSVTEIDTTEDAAFEDVGCFSNPGGTDEGATVTFVIDGSGDQRDCTFFNFPVEGSADTITVEKTCDPDTATGPFNLAINVVDGTTDEFPLLPAIDCGQTRTFLVPLEVFTDVGEGADAFLTELDLPEGVVPTFGGNDCNEEGLIDFGLITPLGGQVGIEQVPPVACTITNTFPPEPPETPETANLTVDKVCPSGEGNATFNVSLNGPTPSAVAPIECDGSLPFADLEPGDYSLEELIAGTSSADFTTAIICSNADGSQTTTQGTEATVTLAGGDALSCTIVNVFDIGAVGDEGPAGDPSCSDGIDNDGDGIVDAQDPSCLVGGGAGGGGTTPPPIIIIPDITNILNNLNANTNTDVNTNTNTLSQNNVQSQDNTNGQNTDVDANPTQNVNAGGDDINIH